MKKKILYITLLMSAILFAVAIPVKAVDLKGTVTAITTGNVSDSTAKEVTVTYDKEEIEKLEWVESGQGGTERPRNGWWLGLK